MFDLSIEKLQFFIVLILPGFVALKVYGLFLPSKITLTSAIGESAIYGLINFAMFHWALLPMNTGDYPQEHPSLYALKSVLFLVITPSLLAALTYWVRTHRPVTNWIDHPHRTGWEFFILKKQECWMLFHLKDGKMFGGYYGDDSYAATPPSEPEVYVEKCYIVDDNGEFLEEVEGTLGTVVRLSDVERVEFLKVKPEGKTNA